VLPIIVSKINMPEVSSNKQEDTCEPKNENRTKNAFQHMSLQSEKEEDKINNSCSKVFSSGSQTISRRNYSSKESSTPLVTSLEFGTNKIKYSHCHFDDESHDLKMDSKRGRETSNSAAGSVHDGNDGETTDDDIFYYRCPQNSSLYCEKEKQINRERVHLDSENKSTRSVSAKTPELSVASKYRSDDRRVFSDNGDHRATETPHFVIGSEPERTENSATGNGKNAGQKSMLTRMKRETRSSHNLVRSKRDENGHAINDRKSLKQENVLTKSKRKATALKHLVGSKREENGYNISDDSDNQKNGNILHRLRRRSDPSYRLIASDHDKSESCVSDDGELLHMENILTRLKRQIKSSNSSENISEDVSGDGENPVKENVPSRRKSRMQICSSSDGSKYDQNGGHIADDGKSPEKENVFKRRERGTETYHLIASGYDKSDTVFISDAGYTSKNKSMFITGEITGMSKHYGHDDMFCTPHKPSLLCKKEKRKTNNSFNESCTSLKSSRTNKYKSVTNNSSQNMWTRNKAPRVSFQHSIKATVCRNENTINSDNSSCGKSAGNDFLTDSHGQQFSGDMLQKINSSQESDGNIHKTDSKLMKGSSSSLADSCHGVELLSRTKTRKVSLVESEHTETEEGDDDDIFYKTPRRSLFCGKEMGRISSICGNESLSCFKSDKANKNNSSQNLSSRNNISRESQACSRNSLVFKNENASDEVSSGDKISAGIEDILTDSYKQQFSSDALEEIGGSSSNNKSGDIHKTDMESSLMKNSRTETQKGNSTFLEHLEEKLLEHEEDDIFYYRAPKQSLPYRKEKNRQF
jgi:hypothetical protein